MEPIYTPGQLQVGRRPVLNERDLERVVDAVAKHPFRQAAEVLGVGLFSLYRFARRQALGARQRGRPRTLVDVATVAATLAACRSLTAAARDLGVDRLTLRRFMSRHRLVAPDGRRRITPADRD